MNTGNGASAHCVGLGSSQCTYQACLIIRFGISYLVLSRITYKSKIKAGILSARQYNRNINAL